MKWRAEVRRLPARPAFVAGAEAARRTVLTAGDHVYVSASPDDAALVRLLFGQAEEA